MTERPSSPDAANRTVPFEDLSLASLPLAKPLCRTDDHPHKTEQRIVNIRGQMFLVEARSEDMNTDFETGRPRVSVFRYTISSPTAPRETKDEHVFIEGEISFHRTPHNSISAITSIHKRKDHVLLEGIGLEFWKKMIPVIANTATQLSSPIEHTVHFSPDTSEREKPLSKERWQEMFSPTLTQEGYAEVRPNTWLKIYEPTQMSQTDH